MTGFPLRSLLVKPAGPDCNLACGYCFYRPKADLFPAAPVTRMRAPVLAEMIRQYAAVGGETCTFCWQGGEPTLLGVEFFEAALGWMARLGSSGQVMANALQTNGLLLDDRWFRLFDRGRFFVGLSLDGPPALHDLHRRDRGGGATFARVRRAARLLEAAGVEFNVLAVVTNDAAREPEALYEFFLNEGLRFVQFIPAAERSPDGALPPWSVTPEAYGEFLCRLFDRWVRDDPPQASIRTFEGFMADHLGLPGGECVHAPRCASYAVVEHDGSVYACDFLVEPAFRLGNLMETPLWELVRGPVWERFAALKPALPERCTACPWLARCGGGCPKHRRDAGGFDLPSYYCDSLRSFFAHAAPRLDALAHRLAAATPG